MKRSILIRIIVVLAGLWIILLGMIYISGEKYRDHAISMLKNQLDNYLLTEIHVRKDNIHVSLLKKFPYAVIDLRDILIKSSPGFNQSELQLIGSDTLLFAENISLIFNLKSLIRKEYMLKKVEIHNAKLNILADRRGNFNYAILKPGQHKDLQDTINIDLKDIRIGNLKLCYKNCKTDILLSGNIQKAQLSGNFIQSEFHIVSQLNLQNTSLDVKGNSILSGDNLVLSTGLQKKESTYIFSNGDLTLFGIRMDAQGFYNSQKGEYNFKILCKAAPLQKLDNTLSDRYLGNLKIKPADGNMDVHFLISRSNSSLSPLVQLNFAAYNGVLKHKTSKIKAKNLYIRGYYTNGQNRNLQSTHLRIDSLSMKSGGSEIYLSGSIQNFNSPILKGHIRGNMELNKLSIFESLTEKIEMDGSISTDVIISGTLPRFKNLKSRDIGRMNLHGFILLNQTSINPVDNTIPSSVISGKINLKNLSEISMENIRVRTGKTDLLLNGNVTNLPFFTSDRTQFPVYRCNVFSNELHLEDFLPVSGNEGDSVKVWFPDSTIIYADFALSSFEFGKFKATGVSGSLFYQPGTFEISDFSMQSQGGTIQSHIILTRFGGTIASDFDADFQHVTISDLFYACNEFGQSVITHKYIGGALTGHADVMAAWDRHLKPLYNKLNIRSKFIIEKGELINYQPLLGLSDYIAVEELRHIKFDDLQGNVRVANEKVIIDQTQVNSSAISLLASGEHDFENNYAYRIQVHLADILWKKAKKKKRVDTEFGYIIDDDHERTILPLIISGKDTVFRVSYDKKTAGSIFRGKLVSEKQEWKELITPDSIAKQDDRNFKIEWQEDTIDETTDTYDDETDDNRGFTIEWDDE